MPNNKTKTETATKMQHRYFMPRPIEFALGTIITTHCKKDGDGYAVYEDGWSDAACLAQIVKHDPKVNINHVATLRVDLVGNFKPAPKLAPKAVETATLDPWPPKWAEDLEERLNDFGDKLGKLEEAMRDNRKADAKLAEKHSAHAKSVVFMYEELKEALAKRLASVDGELKSLRAELRTQDQVLSAEMADLRQHVGLGPMAFKATLNGSTILHDVKLPHGSPKGA